MKTIIASEINLTPSVGADIKEVIACCISIANEYRTTVRCSFNGFRFSVRAGSVYDEVLDGYDQLGREKRY